MNLIYLTRECLLLPLFSIFLVLLFLLMQIIMVLVCQLNSDGLKPVRADSHAPIGVMGEHMHKKGEWMLSYRYMYMDMEGSRRW